MAWILKLSCGRILQTRLAEEKNDVSSLSLGPTFFAFGGDSRKTFLRVASSKLLQTSGWKKPTQNNSISIFFSFLRQSKIRTEVVAKIVSLAKKILFEFREFLSAQSRMSRNKSITFCKNNSVVIFFSSSSRSLKSSRKIKFANVSIQGRLGESSP